MALRRVFESLTSVALGLLFVAGCTGSDTFACTDDSSCPDGRCELNGYCSFPAEDCESGSRYGEFSGPFSGQCVAPSGGSSGTVDTTGPSSETGGPTTGPSTDTTGSPATGEPGPTEDTGTPEPPDTCADASACVPTPPGWEGPVELLDGEACEDGDAAAFSGALAFNGPWSCECSCGVDVPTSCADVGGVLELYEGAGCDGGPAFTEELTQTCQDLQYISSYSVRASFEQEADCDTENDFAAEPVVSLDPRVGCAAPSAACEGGTCLGDDQRNLCIYAAGDAKCPAGAFQNRTVVYQDFVDQRGCDACDCEATIGCGGSVTIRSSLDGCSANESFSVPIGECSDDTFIVRSAEAELDADPQGVCQVSGGENQGGLLPDQPVTVCCSG